jgi:hypothetical protein
MSSRRCSGCPAVLSRYNDGDLCGPCRKRQRDDAIDGLRFEARERISPRKRTVNALPRGGYQFVLRYLVELRERVALRCEDDDDLAVLDAVIEILYDEARLR